ncbi:MAG: hypothetical protein BroJett029_14800 [Alphaproteobacteria bacterium]|nr:MAG: hypothetical protein BroJett029_14800 [Alphaproteobacteria bacterium]
MSFFAAALVALVAAEVLMAAGFGFPNAGIRAPDTLVLVHLVAIGWLSLLMCGALFQFVPVLVARPLYSNSLPLPALLCLVSGLLALILGFLQLAGRIEPAMPFLAAAGALLAAGFALVLWTLVRTLWPLGSLPLPARFVVVGLLSLAATVGYGVVFALVLGGSVADETFVAFAASGLPIHAIAGLGGWLTFTAIGVSYRLLAMFMLAPELNGRRTRAALYLGAGALAVAVLGGGVAIRLGVGLHQVLCLAGLLGLAATALYGADIVQLYRARKRRNIELNSRMAGFALASLAASAVLMVALLALGRLPDHAGAVVFLVAFGWLSGLGLAKLYKIVPFLTWLECYGPVLGKTATPRVQDLVIEKRAVKWFWFYFLAVWSGTVTLLLHQALAFQVAAAGMLVATVGIVVQLVRTRRLLDVKAELRLPQGTHRPRLLLSFVRT